MNRFLIELKRELLGNLKKWQLHRIIYRVAGVYYIISGYLFSL